MGSIQQIDDAIAIDELRAMSERMYGSLVKADVDLERNILVSEKVHA